MQCKNDRNISITNRLHLEMIYLLLVYHFCKVDFRNCIANYFLNKSSELLVLRNENKEVRTISIIVHAIKWKTFSYLSRKMCFVDNSFTHVNKLGQFTKQMLLSEQQSFQSIVCISRKYGLINLYTEKSFRAYRSSHRRCSVKKVFWKISQNSQENTCARVF